MLPLLLASALVMHQGPVPTPAPETTGYKVSSKGDRMVVTGSGIEASADSLTFSPNRDYFILEGKAELTCPQRSVQLKVEVIRLRLADGAFEVGKPQAPPPLSPQLVSPWVNPYLLNSQYPQRSNYQGYGNQPAYLNKPPYRPDGTPLMPNDDPPGYRDDYPPPPGQQTPQVQLPQAAPTARTLELDVRPSR